MTFKWYDSTLFKQQILDSSKLKQFVDDNFKFDENGGKFFKRLDNTVGKGEVDLHEQFLLFPQCFQRLVLQTSKYQGLFGKGLIDNWILTLSQTSPGFYVSAIQSFWKLWSNFSFSLSVFYQFEELSANFMNSEIVVCKLFQFGRI